MRYTSPAVPNHQIYKLRVGLPVSAPTCIAQREVEQCCIAAGNGCRTKQASKEQQRQVAPAGGWQERQGTNKATPCSVLFKTMFQRAACRQHSAMGTHRQQKQGQATARTAPVAKQRLDVVDCAQANVGAEGNGAPDHTQLQHRHTATCQLHLR